MGGETELFRCPCCGQLAPQARLTEEGPFDLEAWLQTWGGKVKLTEADREARRGQGFRRGSAPGRIEYEQQVVSDELRELVKKRLSEIEV